MHVEQVLGDVPKDQRCQCDADSTKSDVRPSWLKSLLGG